jgi:RNA polymerase sigma factor (sigma-70 family)
VSRVDVNGVRGRIGGNARPTFLPLLHFAAERCTVQRPLADVLQSSRRVPSLVEHVDIRTYGLPSFAAPRLAQDLDTSVAHRASRGEHVDSSAHTTDSLVGLVGSCDRLQPEADPAVRERLRALDLARARVALAEGLFVHPRPVGAAVRVLETWLHRDRVLRRAFLVDVPPPAEIVGVIERIHGEIGCQRHRYPTSVDVTLELTAALAGLPWSGEWLIVVLDGIPDRAIGDDVRGLAARWVAERNGFLEAHLGLVRHVVNRHGWSAGAPREDLIQEAYLALCRAVERFDPDRGARFSSYAVPVIRHAIAQYVRRMGSGPGTPGLARSTIVGVSPAQSLRTNGAGRPRRPAPLSLDAPLDDGETLADRLTDPDILWPDLAAAGALEHERLREALGSLPAEIQKIVILHWGLDGSVCRPVHTVAREIGRTPAEVRTLLQNALGFLRNRVTAAADGHSGRRVPGAPRLLAPWVSVPSNGRQRRAADALSGSPTALGNGDAARDFAPIPLRGGGRHP